MALLSASVWKGSQADEFNGCDAHWIVNVSNCKGLWLSRTKYQHLHRERERERGREREGGERDGHKERERGMHCFMKKGG